MVNGEKNVKAGTVGGNSSFLELLSSDCVKAEVVSLDRNLKTQLFQQYNSTETQRWKTVDQMKKKTLPKALRTQALTALTSNFGLVGLVRWIRLGRFGLVGLVW